MTPKHKPPYDFAGWATKSGIRCSDGRTICQGAFKECDGTYVPLVWNHAHNDPDEVLGRALLEHRDNGVYAYGYFNSTTAGDTAKELVQHGDVNSLSIFANNLKQNGGDVIHGVIREVSLVLAGANPGAKIESVIAHSDEDGCCASIYSGEGEGLILSHSDEHEENTSMYDDFDSEELSHAEKSTIGEILKGMTKEQYNVVRYLVYLALNGEEAEVQHSGVEYSDEDIEAIVGTMDPVQRNVLEMLVDEAENAAYDAYYDGYDDAITHSAQGYSDDDISAIVDSMTDEQRLVAMLVSGDNVDVDLSDEDIEAIVGTMDPDQREIMQILVDDAEDSESASDDYEQDETYNDESNEEDGDMAHGYNIFENDDDSMMHSAEDFKQEVACAIADAKRFGSMKEAFIQHGLSNCTPVLAHSEEPAAGAYGIKDINWLFDDYKNLYTPPKMINNPATWVSKVMGAVGHLPFSRVKTMFADVREEEARAKGYIKGKRKKEEVFSLLKRTTDPQTIYKKQKLDRDDVVDITSFDVVAWMKQEMRVKLDEEIARAILIGDGRLTSDDDHIQENHVRPIWKDDSLFTVKATIVVAAGTTAEERANLFIETVIRQRKNYRGSGTPSLYVSEDMLTDMLLIKDKNGRRIYENVQSLTDVLRVKEIVTVFPMGDSKSVTREGTGDDAGKNFTLMGLLVNLDDYKVGADAKGAVNFFDDFDIDYNAQKYLIETRMSGALVVPFSAIAIEETAAA